MSTAGTYLLQQWTLRWVTSGFPSIVLGEKRASDFGATEIPKTLKPTSPFPAFLVILPKGFFVMDREGEREELQYIYAYQNEVLEGDAVTRQQGQVGENRWMVIVNGPSSESCLYKSNIFLHEAGDAGWHEPTAPTDLVGDDADERVLALSCNIVSQVCWAFDQPEVRERTKARAKSKSRRKQLQGMKKPLSNYVFTEDVFMDVTGPVKEYLKTGRGKSPVVRSLVRPHIKRVRYGEKHALTRWQRIEGYIRGPSGAPMAIKNYKWKD